MAQEQGPKIQLVVFHSPGENWPADGKVSFDNPEVQSHGKYWGMNSAAVEKGGPFPGKSGGMMVLKPNVTLDKAKELAAADPAVKSKFIKAEVRQWMIFLEAQENAE